MYYSKSTADREAYLKKNPKILKKILNLGLDLQGGMRLVLEVDRSRLDKDQQKDVLDRAYTIIENRVNALGVAEPIIQKQGQDRIIVELPGLKDEAMAKGVIGRTAQLEFNLLREPVQLDKAINTIENVLAGKATIAKDTIDSLPSDTTSQKSQEQQSVAEKLFKGSEKDSAAAADTSKDTTEEVAEVTSFKDLLASYGDQLAVKEDDMNKVRDILTRSDVREALARAGLGDNNFLWGHDTSMINGYVYRSLYYVKSTPEMRGDIIKDANGTLNQGGFQAGAAKVDLEMNAKGARKFSSVTAANVNKFLAIVLDSTVYSAPRIIQKISGGRAEITGNFTLNEAKNLAIVLRAGALPAPVTIIEERTVGPSLGQDSIKNSVMAGIIGTILVILFMIIYYGISGVLAIVILFLSLLGVLATMAGINVTLTLPGIAGLILQIGMGVDANVLIYERIREELRLGKTVKSAIDAGFEKAFVTIMDSNITTIVTALILYWKGTGPIKGFAITLTLGLLVILYTALFVSRVLMELVFKKNQKTMSI